MTAVHQLIPSLAEWDAVGQHALQVQRLLQDRGIDSEIFTEYEAAGALRSRVRSYRTLDDLPADGRARFIYQASTGSAIGDWVVSRSEPIIVNYHNVTPAEFFGPWEPLVAAELRAGRAQIQDLAGLAALGIGDSPYHAAELDLWGYRSTTVVPVLFDTATFDREPDPGTTAAVEARRAAGGSVWLFVGRIAPNKCQQDLIKALAYTRRFVDPNAHLVLVGKSSSARYLRALETFVSDLGLGDAVTFAGGASAESLTAYYRSADVFVCASEHEGFCVPIIEAMHHRLPVIAFGSTAIPGTIGDGGLVLRGKAPSVIAEAVQQVVTDPVLRDQMVVAGSERVQSFALPVTRAQMWDALAPFVN